MALDELDAGDLELAGKPRSLVDEAFADAMDATTDDAFLARALRAMRGRSAPLARRMLRGPIPLAARLLRAGRAAQARGAATPRMAMIREASRRRLLRRLGRSLNPRIRRLARAQLRRSGGVQPPADPGILARLRRPGRGGDLRRLLRRRGGGSGVEEPTPDETPSEDERRQEEYRQATFEQWQDTTNEWLRQMQETAAGEGLDRLVDEAVGDTLADAVDSFADAAAQRAHAGEDIDAMIPVLAGLAARRSIRTLVPPGALRTRPAIARGLARTLVPAVSIAARRLSRRFGPGALPIVPHLLGAATDTVVRRGLRPAAVADRLRGLTARALARPELARTLGRPAPATRRLVRRVLAGSGLRADGDSLDALDGDYATPEVAWERANQAGRSERSQDGSSVVIWNFAVDSPALKPEHLSAIRGFARDFARSRSLRDLRARVSIIGHASRSGNRRYNLDLSRARARASAEAFLNELGRNLRGRIPRGAESSFLARFRQNRLTVGGRGIAESRSGGSSPEAMARNRRVELSIDTLV